MDKKILKYGFIWGFILWFIGYALGVVLYPFVPTSHIGWFIMPVGLLITVWVLWKKVKLSNLKEYLILASVWTIIAIIFDYVFLVRLLKPADGYYKLDVYLYYLLTFVMPVIIGKRKKL